jgi:hypothetical protein
VVLADGKDDRLADLAADRVAQRMFEEGFAENLVGGFGEETLLELAVLISLLTLRAIFVGELNKEALVGEQLGSDIAAGVNN